MKNTKLIPFHRKNKWGFINNNFDIVIYPEYDWVDDFHYGYSAVKIENKYTYININNNRVFKNIYDYSFPFKFGIGVLSLNDKYLTIDSNGNLLKNCNFNDYPIITEKMIYGKKGDGTTFYNHTGDEIFHLPSIIYSGQFSEGKAVVEKSFTQYESKYGVINEKGEFVIEVIYDGISDFKENLAIVKKNRKYGLIDKDGIQVTPICFDDIDFFSYGNVTRFEIVEDRIIAKKNGLYGFISRFGNTIIEYKYDLVTRFLEGISIVKVQEKFGAIDSSGNQIIPIIYDWLDTNYIFGSNPSQKVIVAKLNRLCGILDLKGNSIIELSNREIGVFYGDYATIKIGNKFGIINIYGELIVTPTYDSISIISKDVAIVKKIKYGLLSTTGKTILPCSFSFIKILSNLTLFELRLEEEESVFYCDLNGKIFYPK